MIERRPRYRMAQGRPWGRLPGQLEPPAELTGCGARLAAGLAALAPTLAGLEPGEVSRGRLVDIAVAAAQVQGWAAAIQAQASAELFEHFRAEHQQLAAGLGPCARAESRTGPQSVEALAVRQATASLSLALGVSLPAADRALDFARTLAAQPVLADALTVGRLDTAQARTIHDAVKVLPPAQRTRLVEAVAADPDTLARARMVKELRCGTRLIWQLPPHKLRPILDREIAATTPDLITDRATASQAARRVRHSAGTPTQSGTLTLEGPEHLLAAAYTALDHTARAARHAGAQESIDQLRFDLAIGALTGATFGLTTGDHPPQARPGAVLVNITTPLPTLLGLDEAPVTLHTPSGDVQIPAEVARRIAHDPDLATWRRILCDPTTGTALEVSPTYKPPRRIVEFTRIRDGHTSRFPTSGARHLELDHIREYHHHNPATGGPTSSANLSSAGKRDHQDKTDRLIKVTGDANGVLTYTTGTGHTYHSWPHQYLDPDPPPTQPPTDPDPPF